MLSNGKGRPRLVKIVAKLSSCQVVSRFLYFLHSIFRKAKGYAKVLSELLATIE